MASQHDLATTLLGLAGDDLAAAKILLDAESSPLIDRLTPFVVQARYSGVQVPDLALETALAWADKTLEWSRAQLESSETTEQRAQDPPH